MKNIYLQLLRNIKEDTGLVLATVTATSGSTPQKAGSSALFDKSGLIYGTVGGGILEGKVTEIAIKASISKRSGHYVFRLDRSSADGEDALCGGTIKVLVDSDLQNHSSVFEDIGLSLRSRIPGILATIVTETGDETIMVRRYWITNEQELPFSPGIGKLVSPELKRMFSSLKPDDYREITLASSGREAGTFIYLEPVIPPLRLIIAGAGHIGKALSGIGQMLDFEVTVIDDRPEFANPENIKSADHIVTGDIESSMVQIEKGEDTFIVIVTRGHKDDAGALRACINSEARYIGMIGSRNKVALMHREFVERGWASEKQWGRVYSPVGIDIGSKTVEEIAVSIAAQLIQVKNIKK